MTDYIQSVKPWRGRSNLGASNLNQFQVVGVMESWSNGLWWDVFFLFANTPLLQYSRIEALEKPAGNPKFGRIIGPDSRQGVIYG